MPRLHALELIPDAEGEAAVRRDWQALRDAGLPSQLDHAGDTDTPHVTVLALPAIGPHTESAAADLLGTVLPVAVRVSGVAFLGGDRVTVARLLDVPPHLVRGVLELRTRTEEERHVGWLPHVTLGRRVPRADVARVLEVLGYDDVLLTLTALRRWDPERHQVRLL